MRVWKRIVRKGVKAAGLGRYAAQPVLDSCWSKSFGLHGVVVPFSAIVLLSLAVSLFPTPALAAPKWGAFKKDACTRPGFRQYSAQLQDIPWGQSWEQTCARQQADVQGQHFSSPTRCKNTGIGGEWGEFDVPDQSCMPNWGAFKQDACKSMGIRQFSSQLQNIPPGISWENACASTSATVAGQAFSAPTRCRNTGLGGEWGEFDVPDQSCMPAWGAFKRDACKSVGIRQFSSQLQNIPPGISWESACASTSATVAGQAFNAPTRCKNLGLGGEWGEFDVKDTSCPSWGAFKQDDCSGLKKRQFSAILQDIPAGLSWEAACAQTPATVRGTSFSSPTRCRNTVVAMWGEFDLPDDSCVARWGAFKKDECKNSGKRQYSAQLQNIPRNTGWDQACQSTPATIGQKQFDQPLRCKNTGIGGEWGEFEVDDVVCDPGGVTYILFDPPANKAMVGMAATPSGKGYWLVGADGGVFVFGDAGFFGSKGNQSLTSPVVGMAVTPSGKGYWLAAADGTVFPFGDARLQVRHQNGAVAGPMTGITATPSGNGYWLATSGGTVVSFGDAQVFAKSDNRPLSSHVVGIAGTPSGKGYWLASSDGDVFNFGDAKFFGSMQGKSLFRPVVGIQRTASGQGYTLVAADSGIFTFGDAGFFGSFGGILYKEHAFVYPVVGMAATPSGKGYWAVDSSGGIFPFGDASVGWRATLGGHDGPGLSSGNQVEVLVDGQAMFASLLKAVNQARKNINILQLVFNPEFIAEFSAGDRSRLADALVAASKRGVSVRIMVDKILNTKDAGPGKLKDFFSDSGAFVSVRNIGLFEPERLHAKAVIIDDTTAFVLGGTLEQSMWDSNDHPIDSVERGGEKPLHTLSIRVNGPAVADVDRLFVEIWNNIDHNFDGGKDQLAVPPPPPAAGPQTLQIVRSIPAGHIASAVGPVGGEKGVLEAYERAFANARRYIYVEHQYLTNRLIVDAIRNAMDRNPDLQVIAVLNQNPDIPGYIPWQNKLILSKLGFPRPQLGVFSLWSLDAKAQKPSIRRIYMEGKTAIVDDVWLTLGTGNLDGISLSAFETPDNQDPNSFFAFLTPVLENRRSVEINAALFDGIEGAPATGVAARLRCTLWQEQLGVPSAPVCGVEPPGRWLSLWNSVANGNVQSLNRPLPAMRGHVLPWAPGGFSKAGSQLNAIGVDLTRLTIRNDP
ncbi:MAG TPA: phosphatidylserine/phosphatidylglycerophosphate/cardiolipin synthase family protein [Candidatus Angelobacter sp.]|jgi:phosphatidylserine/phosphatidylglycerophosphate/cardiolipin synthase-like enzyme|nr:phosphatidylserine/phosphatidylglycerophosphate/cardiolipin synthase family protein [Candidatus Angelobacter sp.]